LPYAHQPPLDGVIGHRITAIKAQILQSVKPGRYNACIAKFCKFILPTRRLDAAMCL
jgi:hypothetical protein